MSKFLGNVTEWIVGFLIIVVVGGTISWLTDGLDTSSLLTLVVLTLLFVVLPIWIINSVWWQVKKYRAIRSLRELGYNVGLLGLLNTPAKNIALAIKMIGDEYQNKLEEVIMSAIWEVDDECVSLEDLKDMSDRKFGMVIDILEVSLDAFNQNYFIPEYAEKETQKKIKHIKALRTAYRGRLNQSGKQNKKDNYPNSVSL